MNFGKSLSKKDKQDHHLRENYEDHSLHFQKWVHRFGIERTFFGRLAFYLEEKLNLKRFSFVLLFSIVLALAINFEIRTPIDYKIGDTVQSDIIAPLSFEMVDEVTTEEKRQKAEMGIPFIFDFDPTVFERVSNQLYKAFRLMRAELKNISWPKTQVAREEKVKEFFTHKGEFERELGANVSDYLFEWLVQNRFSARIENIIIRNLDKWYLEKIGENIDKAVSGQKQVVARVVTRNAKGREFALLKKEIIDVSHFDLFTLKDFRGLERSSSQDQINILAIARQLIYPNLTLNKQEMAFRRNQAREGVLPISISVKKNQVLLGHGTLIQPFHMALLKEIESLKSDRRKDLSTLAQGLFFLALIVVFFQYLRRFSQRVKVETKDVILMGIVLLGVVILTKVFWFTTETALSSKFGTWLPAATFLFLSPVASGPMLVGLVIQSGEVVWLFTAFMSIVMAVMTESNFSFLIVTLVGGIAAARGVYSCKKRNDIYWAGVRTGAVNALMVVLTHSVTRIDQPDFFRDLMITAPAGFIGGIMSSLVAMFTIPLIESMFNYTTDVKLLELSNLNHPLLKDMFLKAPGTYYHSMMVGNMVEAAAEEIGANPLLAKVMSYYHDIGKMEHSNYFIENQKQGQNPHDHISPYMSKTLLVAHVKDGVELGMKYKLGKPIIDGIIQHHGTTLISYFYNKAADANSETDGEIAEEEFCYPGPKPLFRESALIMLADSIEAAARSLDEPTPVRLQNIVRNIVQRKFMEGQLAECSLTLMDLSKVETAFTRILLGIYHQRIDYPKRAGGGASETPANQLFNPGGRES